MANADTLDGAGVNSGNALDVAKLQNNSETTKDKGQKRALERESRVRQSLMEGKLLWKRAEIASDYSDLNQGLYKQPGMLSEPAVQVRVHPQSDLSTAKIQQNSEITKLSSKKELPPVTPLGTNRRGISKAAHGAALLSGLSSTEEPGCAELLRPAVCSFRTIASVLRRLESRFSSRYRRLPQTLADVQMHP